VTHIAARAQPYCQIEDDGNCSDSVAAVAATDAAAIVGVADAADVVAVALADIACCADDNAIHVRQAEQLFHCLLTRLPMKQLHWHCCYCWQL